MTLVTGALRNPTSLSASMPNPAPGFCRKELFHLYQYWHLVNFRIGIKIPKIGEIEHIPSLIRRYASQHSTVGALYNPNGATWGRFSPDQHLPLP